MDHKSIEKRAATNSSGERNSVLASSILEPDRPVFDDPIHQGAFKTDVVASFLALYPFMPQDLLAFS
jgi:hypothetical protein